MQRPASYCPHTQNVEAQTNEYRSNQCVCTFVRWCMLGHLCMYTCVLGDFLCTFAFSGACTNEFRSSCLFIYIFALPRARIPIQGCGLIEYHFINVAIVLNESAVLDWESRCACPGLFFPRGIALGENKMRRVTVQVE